MTRAPERLAFTALWQLSLVPLALGGNVSTSDIVVRCSIGFGCPWTRLCWIASASSIVLRKSAGVRREWRTICSGRIDRAGRVTRSEASCPLHKTHAAAAKTASAEAGSMQACSKSKRGYRVFHPTFSRRRCCPSAGIPDRNCRASDARYHFGAGSHSAITALRVRPLLAETPVTSLGAGFETSA